MDMLIAGNWKMNTDLDGAVELAQEIVGGMAYTGHVQVAICPPFPMLGAVNRIVRETPVLLGAQNMFYEDEGAYTGEVSAPMLRAIGCEYVILGHSERRQYFGETDEGVNKKARRALEHGLKPIVCIGETLEQREAGKEREIVKEQLQRGLDGVSITSADGLVIAYEPVWAIGTGRNATAEQAQEMHGYIRELLRGQFGDTITPEMRILYGGSMKPGNAKELLAQPDVDGGLVGGASLKAGDFLSIVRSAVEIAQ
ncbi:MAG TPA: triose-phosphate isomerase [Rhodothermales bacterium]|nr:triose-phosphate isomerase [Rhodothermales bacterium]